MLGLTPGATAAEITAAYRRAVRDCHPDAPHPDRDRLAAVIAAYRHLRDQLAARQSEHRRRAETRPAGGHDIPVRVRLDTAPPGPDLRAGPVRHHPGPRR
ncbi:J domain-containing protein [Pseudonocardia kujensis]|uniref:J domain-containing protein n=1 Tax=Pseudonocardia kujensis TaxID=1128675 RepID=UPI001E303BE8|nr:J domain-containing protein [Pseudonocardia kujensis]MCE0767032.1 J domain-containing protein [Pseudonocardia kujensis]